MTVALDAVCTRCREVFALFELRDDGTGRCPRCGRSLAPDWTATLITEAIRVDRAQRELVDGLRRLQSVPAHMVVRPRNVLSNIIRNAGWRRTLAEHDDVLREELDVAYGLIEEWWTLTKTAQTAMRRRRRRWRDGIRRSLPALVGAFSASGDHRRPGRPRSASTPIRSSPAGSS